MAEFEVKNSKIENTQPLKSHETFGTRDFTPTEKALNAKVQDVREETLPTAEYGPEEKPTATLDGYKVIDAKENQLTEEQVQVVQETIHTEVHKIINNEARIDEIFKKLDGLEQRIEQIDADIAKLEAQAPSPTRDAAIRELKRERELKNQHIDHLLDELILRISSFYCHMTQDEAMKFREFMKQDVQNFQKALKDKTTLITIIVSGIAGIVGAGLGFSQGGLLGFTATQVKAAGGTLTAASQGVGLYAQLSIQQLQVGAQWHMFLKETDSQRFTDMSQAKQSETTHQGEYFRHIQSRESSRHEAFKERG